MIGVGQIGRFGVTVNTVEITMNRMREYRAVDEQRDLFTRGIGSSEISVTVTFQTLVSAKGLRKTDNRYCDEDEAEFEDNITSGPNVTGTHT
jgi:hypothetical protein